MKCVVVVERRYLGSGATGKSGVLVRMHSTNVPEVRLAFDLMVIILLDYIKIEIVRHVFGLKGIVYGEEATSDGSWHHLCGRHILTLPVGCSDCGARV